MQTSKQRFREFMNENFKGFRLKQPLFFRWPLGLRFDLQIGEVGTESYFKESLNRASILFQEVFASSDEIFLVLIDFRHRRRKIRFSNFIFRQVKGLTKNQITYSRIKGLYEPTDKFDIRNVAVVELRTERVDYETILSAIENTDFPPRQPRLDENGVLSSKEVYFLVTV